MEKIKVAVIGCGTIANNAHIPAYLANEQAEIKYFCDVIAERADAAVEKYRCGKAVYDSALILLPTVCCGAFGTYPGPDG